MTPTAALGLSIRLSMFELRETGDWDIFLAVHQSIFGIFTNIVLFSLYPTSADPGDHGVEILGYLPECPALQTLLPDYKFFTLFVLTHLMLFKLPGLSRLELPDLGCIELLEVLLFEEVGAASVPKLLATAMRLSCLPVLHTYVLYICAHIYVHM